MNNTGKVSKSKEKFKEYIHKQVTEMFTTILDFTEIAVGDKERHRMLRAKILRISNDAIRSIHKELEGSYNMDFVAKNEDVIVVRKK